LTLNPKIKILPTLKERKDVINRATTKERIPKGSSKAKTSSAAAGELYIELGDQNFAAVFFFTSGDYDLNEFGESLSIFYPNVPLIGCTTAGIIGKEGYDTNSVCAFGFPKSHFSIDSDVIKDVAALDISVWAQVAKDMLIRFEQTVGSPLSGQTFGLVLIDGLSLAEESVLSAIYPELGAIPLFGGSTGDDLRFEETQIYYKGQILNNAAVLILVQTICPFHVFRTEHFVETDRKMVITGADPASRLVQEINASPATEEYARLVGVKPDDLNPSVFAAHPVMVRVGGAYYVRSIQKPEGEDGLKFFCAIDEGLVLTLAKGEDIVTNLQKTLHQIEDEVGTPELIIGCDCIFRKLELEQSPDKFDQVSRILVDHKVFGFSTYGEQFAGMHVNQTFTGVAIGWEGEHD
jgi:hypothetical protein